MIGLRTRLQAAGWQGFDCTNRPQQENFCNAALHVQDTSDMALEAVSSKPRTWSLNGPIDLLLRERMGLVGWEAKGREKEKERGEGAEGEGEGAGAGEGQRGREGGGGEGEGRERANVYAGPSPLTLLDKQCEDGPPLGGKRGQHRAHAIHNLALNFNPVAACLLPVPAMPSNALRRCSRIDKSTCLYEMLHLGGSQAP